MNLSPPGWMSHEGLEKVELTGPFERLISEKKNSEPGSASADPEVEGTLAYPDRSSQDGMRRIPVRIKVRGHSSWGEDECTFPKLTLKLDPARVAGTPFAGIRKLKIGTHCGDQPDPSSWLTPNRRILNEVSIVREAFAYELLRTIGVTTLATRLVEITYHDSEKAKDFARKAMLLEDDGEFARRIGARQVAYTEDTMEGPENPELPVFRDAQRSGLALAQVSEVLLAEALVGNPDYLLRVSPEDHSTDGEGSLYNLYIYEDAVTREKLLVPYDFDVASAINGKSSLEGTASEYDPDFLDHPDLVKYFILLQVQHARAVLPRKELAQAREKFLNAREAAYRALESFPLDAEGKANFKAHLDFFYRAIDGFFELPVVLRPNSVTAYRDSSRRRSCGPLPYGTLVRVIGERGDLQQVRVLYPVPGDGDSCMEVGPFWIAKGSRVGTDYPLR